MLNGISDLVTVLDLGTKMPPDPIAREEKFRDCMSNVATLQSPGCFKQKGEKQKASIFCYLVLATKSMDYAQGLARNAGSPAAGPDLENQNLKFNKIPR